MTVLSSMPYKDSKKVNLQSGGFVLLFLFCFVFFGGKNEKEKECLIAGYK